MEKFLANLMSLGFLKGYRTHFAVATSILGGLTLIMQSLSAPDGPNWAQMGVGIMGLGNALGFSGVAGKVMDSGAGTNAGKVATGGTIST